MSIVASRAKLIVPGAALTATVLTLALAAPGAGAQPFAPARGGMALAARNGDNGTVKIHNSTTSVTDPRNEPHVCVFYLDAFGFDPAQSVSWLIKSWPPTGDRAVVASGALALDSNGDGHTGDMTLQERALQAVLELRRRTWLRQAEGVLGGVRRPHPDPDPQPDAERLADAERVAESQPDAERLADAERVAESQPELASRPARSGTDAGGGDPSRDGLKYWELTAAGSCAAGSRASAATPCASSEAGWLCR